MCRCNSQKQPPGVIYKKGVLRNFTKFTEKHLCQSLFLNRVAGLRPQAWQNTSGPLLLNCTYSFFIVFFFAFAFFPFVIIFTDWFLLATSYFNAATLSKVINNQIKQNFPRFPTFWFWVKGKTKNSKIWEYFIFSIFSISEPFCFSPGSYFVVFKSWFIGIVRIWRIWFSSFRFWA